MFHNTLEKFEFSGCIERQSLVAAGMVDEAWSAPRVRCAKAVMRNEFMNYPLHRWPEGRASKLAEKLVEKLDGEAP